MAPIILGRPEIPASLPTTSKNSRLAACGLVSPPYLLHL
jgi:hypothetical protein